MTTRTPLSIADLLEGLAAKQRYKYVFFWGDTPKRDDSVDQSCLSQWYGASFTVDGVRYATAEHWMMASKARLFGDDESAEKAINAGHPVDRIWGIGLAASDERAEHPAQWRGLNLLGFALIQARLKLAGTQTP